MDMDLLRDFSFVQQILSEHPKKNGANIMKTYEIIIVSIYFFVYLYNCDAKYMNETLFICSYLKLNF